MCKPGRGACVREWEMGVVGEMMCRHKKGLFLHSKNSPLRKYTFTSGYSHPGTFSMFFLALDRKGSLVTFLSASHALSYCAVFW